jgi:hypothetical protein
MRGSRYTKDRKEKAARDAYERARPKSDAEPCIKATTHLKGTCRRCGAEAGQPCKGS